MKDALLLEVKLHAGSIFMGHVFFKTKHPITSFSISSNFFEDIKGYAEKENLKIDPELEANIHKLLVRENHYWSVPVDHCSDILSVHKYLKQYFLEHTDFFI